MESEIRDFWHDGRLPALKENTLSAIIVTDNMPTDKNMANKIMTNFFKIRQILAVELFRLFYTL